MLKTLLSRIPQLVIVVIGASFLTFAIVNILPGDIVHQILGDSYTPEAAAQLRSQLHLNDPFLVRYLRYIGDALTGNLGTSLVPPHQDVSELVGKAIFPTLELVVLGQICGIVIGILLAVLSVATRNRIVDAVISAIALVTSSLPGFVLGLLLLELLSVKLQLVSPLGWVSPFDNGGDWGQNLSHIALPSVLVGLFSFPLIMRVFRAELVDRIDNEDYIVLARLKGLSTRRVITAHMIRNSSFGVVTVVGVNVARLIGGIVVIEQVFSIPGMGTLIRNSVIQHDAATSVACISLVAIFVVVVNLLVDLAYAWLDPQVRDAA